LTIAHLDVHALCSNNFSIPHLCKAIGFEVTLYLLCKFWVELATSSMLKHSKKDHHGINAATLSSYSMRIIS